MVQPAKSVNDAPSRWCTSCSGESVVMAAILHTHPHRHTSRYGSFGLSTARPARGYRLVRTADTDWRRIHAHPDRTDRQHPRPRYLLDGMAQAASGEIDAAALR